MLTLTSLQPKSRKHKRRIGRGNGSGRGTFSGRGMKGQRSRSGSRGGLKLRGLRSLMKAIPKVRGGARRFHAERLTTVTLAYLERKCSANTTIELRGNKVLGSGEITKPLLVKASAFSASAKAKIEAAGGKAIPCGKQ
ncbi:MAG: uL15 family ribosomal protein [Patescibacteria group bacterium]|jgi:large subunit ribosomal protein L15